MEDLSFTRKQFLKEAKKLGYYKKDGFDCGYHIDYDPKAMNRMHNRPKNMSYDDYIWLQYCSRNTHRKGFACVKYGMIWAEYYGEVSKIEKQRILFKRIVINGDYPDGEGYTGKEDHVWINRTKEINRLNLQPHGCISFEADVYQYYTEHSGSPRIDYGLYHLRDIQKIERYRILTHEEIAYQELERMFCESCPVTDYCDHSNCIR